MAKKGKIKGSDLSVLTGVGEGDGVATHGRMTITKKGSLVTRSWVSDDGSTNIMKWDVNKSRTNAISSEYIPSSANRGTIQIESEEVDNESLPKTKRQYLNPANNKMVGYARAKTLGIII